MKHLVGAVVGLLVLACTAWMLLRDGPVEPSMPPASEKGAVESAPEPVAVRRDAANHPDSRDVSPTTPPATATSPSAARDPVVHVVGIDGGSAAPLAGALVRVVTPTTEWALRTDAAGDAALPPDCRGVAALWAEADGWGTRRVSPVRLEATTTQVELLRGARVRLAWRSERGDELSAADARARYESAGTPATARLVAESAIDTGGWSDAVSPLRMPPEGWQRESVVAWESAGSYLSGRLAAGRWRLLVRRPAARPYLSAPFAATDGADAVVEVQLSEPPPVRRVQFLDAADGTSLGGATVVPWFTLVKDFAQVPGAPIAADAKGVAALPMTAASAEPPTIWSVECGERAGEFEDALLGSRSAGDPVVVRLFRTATVTGTVYARPGVPAADAEVAWASRAGPSVRCECGADGRFRLEGVRLRRAPDEMVSLSVVFGAARRFHAVQVSAGSVTEVTLGAADPAAQLGRVEVRVTAGGRALAGLQVVLAPLADPRTLLFGATGSDGEFGFDAVPAGAARIRVTCGDPRVSDAWRIASRSPLPVSNGETTTLSYELPDAAFAVTVVDASTGAPLEGIRVTAAPGDVRDAATRFPGAVFNPGWSAFTDAAGRAFLPGVVAAAPHRIEARDAAGRSASLADALPGTVAAPSELRLELGQ